MAMHEADLDRVVRQGTEAWRRLKKDKNYGDWIKVGEAHQVGREWAMNQAGTNKPEGKAYNIAFGEWLTRYKFDDMDKGNRSRLFELMDNLPQIEDWRRTLTLGERLKLNHPNAVLRKWKAFMKPEPRDKSGEPKPTLRDSVVNLSEEAAAKDRKIADLESHIEELEAARAPPAAGDSAHHAINVLLECVNDKTMTARIVSELARDTGYDGLDLLELSKWFKDLRDAVKHRTRQKPAG